MKTESEVTIEEKKVDPPVVVDEMKELIAEILAKMELVLEGQRELFVRLTAIECPVAATLDVKEEVTEVVDKDVEINDKTEELIGEVKMDEFMEEFKKVFHTDSPSLEEVKGLFAEMNDEIKAAFAVQS